MWATRRIVAGQNREVTIMPTLYPRQPVPALEVPTLDGPVWRLADQTPTHFTMVVFYRGLHCPICATYLRDLDRRLEAFEQLGVRAVAISSDSEDRARESRSRWDIERLTIGYGLDLDRARDWGLFVSSGRGKTSTGVEEPERFSEPGLFLVRPDRTLYASSINTMPFARPNFGELVKSIEFIVAKDYPARGEVV